VEMPWIGCAKAVIEAYLGGQAVGGATADVLYGKVNPCGRLPESFPVKLEDNPSYLTYGGEGDTAVYSEGVFVGYRYYDKKKMDVLFPFGHGLSYTDFSYSNLRLSSESIRDTETLTVSVDVTNTGAYSGKEVIQLYVSDVESSVFRPVHELKGFEKIHLEPGETKTVAFDLDKRTFAWWNEKIHDWYAETGTFTIEIAKSSRNVVLTRDVFVESTADIPEKFTVDSIFDDLMRSPKAIPFIKPIMDNMIRNMGGGDDNASEAITNDMINAMIRYSPLRSVASFSGGAMSYDQLAALVDQINNS